MSPVLASFEIEDDFTEIDHCSVDVRVRLTDGQERWCFFMLPGTLGRVGDWLPGTEVRVHFGAPHMIVVSELNPVTIELALKEIDARGELEACTRPIQESASVDPVD